MMRRIPQGIGQVIVRELSVRRVEQMVIGLSGTGKKTIRKQTEKFEIRNAFVDAFIEDFGGNSPTQARWWQDRHSVFGRGRAGPTDCRTPQRSLIWDTR